jgi:NitT/TauT family transport system substrate-binding protein
VKKEWLATHQKAAHSLLRGLVRAEEELAQHPDEITALLAKQLNTPLADLQSMLAEQRSVVSLDQVLLLSLEDETRWMQETGIVTGKTVPNYLRLLEPSTLKGVNPEAVQLK